MERREFLNFLIWFLPITLIINLLIFNDRVGKHYSIANTILLADLILLFVSIGIYTIARKFKKSLGDKILERETVFDANHSNLKHILKYDTDFRPLHFLYRVESLADRLNEAWCNHKMEKVRNLVSAGLFNRFQIQLKLMKEEGTMNVMQNWFLDKLSIQAIETDSTYHTIHVNIKARAKDLNLPINTSPKDVQIQLSETKQNQYTEIWSFVRKVNAKTDSSKFILSGNCPNCGSNILNLGELNRCEHCKTIINSGEYDWVLSEITQIEEWKESNLNNQRDIVEPIQKEYPFVNVQTLEDRVSYLFWRWIYASRIGKIKPLKRDVIASFSENFHPTIYRYDVAVGAVELHSLNWNEKSISARVLVLWSGAASSGSEPTHQEHYFYVIINKNVKRLNGLAENTCDVCGAPLPESDSLTCSYCSSSISAVVDDWLLEKIEAR